MQPYLIVTDGPCALSMESSDRELVYTNDAGAALTYATRGMAEGSPWFCVGDVAMRKDEFERMLQH